MAYVVPPVLGELGGRASQGAAGSCRHAVVEVSVGVFIVGEDGHRVRHLGLRAVGDGASHAGAARLAPRVRAREVHLRLRHGADVDAGVDARPAGEGE